MGPPARAELLYGHLLFTAGLCGAAVMVLEVVGSRVVGPLFGVSLFVWTALIGVTLVALAAGYAVGGQLADRRPSADTLQLVLLLAGAAILAIPPLRAPVLQACVPLGLRLGSLAAAAILFGPPLLLLGCVSPLVVKLAAHDLDRVGRTVGRLYAISTGGSFLGTLATGFYLIGRLGTGHVLQLVGGVLLAWAGLYFVAVRRRPVALLALALLALPAERPLVDRVMANGTRVQELWRSESHYGRVQVLEYSYGAARTRELAIDGLVQGGIDVASGLPVYEFAYFLELLPRALLPEGRSCLVIGLGAGLVPRWYERQGVRTDVVDINPDVVQAARQHFGYQAAGDVRLGDARQVLAEPGPRYDYVVLDVFTGDTTPGHLLSLEALRLAAGRLAPGGVLALNLAGSLRRQTLMTASVVRTLEEVFETVEVVPNFDPSEGEGWGNLTVLAYPGPLRPFDPARVAAFPVHPLAREGVTRNLARRFRFPAGTPAHVLTDDFNPLDVGDLPLKERVRRGILEATDWDVLS